MEFGDLKEGQVMVIYDDLKNRVVNKIAIQLLNNKAVILDMNTTDKNVGMTIMDTNIEDLEYSGNLDKTSLEKLIRSLKDMYIQL